MGHTRHKWPQFTLHRERDSHHLTTAAGPVSFPASLAPACQMAAQSKIEMYNARRPRAAAAALVLLVRGSMCLFEPDQMAMWVELVPSTTVW